MQSSAQPRYLSLDVLRGLTIALMVIVNSPGTWEAVYGPLKHAPWNGFTLTDMVFPSFLFVVGNAMAFSMEKSNSGLSQKAFTKVIRRTFLIFMIGVFLNLFPFVRISEQGQYVPIDLSQLRVYGVLQRIALCYCFAALVIAYFNKKGMVIFSIVVLVGYWIILTYFGDQPDPFSLENNAIRKLDLLLVGPAHIYKGEGVPFDPEGLLSTLPAIVNVLVGYLTASYLRSINKQAAGLTKLLLVGVLLITLSLLWHQVFPFNKKIWTSSYTLLTVGISTVVLGCLVYVIDVLAKRRWTYFFEVFGKNSLALYVLSMMLVKIILVIRVGDIGLRPWIYNNLFLSWSNAATASLCYAISMMLIVWVVGYLLDRRKIYIKV